VRKEERLVGNIEYVSLAATAVVYSVPLHAMIFKQYTLHRAAHGVVAGGVVAGNHAKLMDEIVVLKRLNNANSCLLACVAIMELWQG